MSIYIHIPFCTSICTYCDFCKIIYNKKYINNYLSKLEEEIKERYNGEKVKTVFIGGGTPTSLDVEELEKLLKITLLFNKNNNIEFTIESNVESITEDKLKLLRKYNVNRISIGVESFNEDILKILGRKHKKKDIFEKIKLVKKYFDNINIDLIYAVTSNINIIKDDVNEFLKLDIPHISAYSLIIEDNTMLKIKNYNNIDEDIDYEMYKYIETTLENSGYIHYEISNYAKRGFESRHNLTYWNNEDYYGFGLSSTSFLKNKRMVNYKNLSKYLRGNFIETIDTENKKTRMENEVMLGLRKLEGINLDDFKRKYNQNFYDVFDIAKLVEDNYLVTNNNYIKINKEYIYVSNEIIIRVIDSEK